MAWSQNDLDALDTAIARGVKSVTFADGRRTEYQTTADMLAARKQMKAELIASASQVNPIPRATRGRMRRP